MGKNKIEYQIRDQQQAYRGWDFIGRWVFCGVLRQVAGLLLTPVGRL